MFHKKTIHTFNAEDDIEVPSCMARNDMFIGKCNSFRWQMHSFMPTYC